jgi:hypothetical protein
MQEFKISGLGQREQTSGLYWVLGKSGEKGVRISLKRGVGTEKKVPEVLFVKNL